MANRSVKKIIISLADLSKITGYTKRWINDLAKQSNFPRITRGQYDLVDCFKWFLNYKDTQIAALKQPSSSMEKSEQRKAQYQADMLELKLQIARAQVIDIDTFIREIDDVHMAIRSILLGISKHAERELNNKEIGVYLDNHMRKALIELASVPSRIDRLAEFATKDMQIGGDIEAAAEINNQPVGGQVPHFKPRSKRRKRAMGNKQSRVPKGDDGLHT